jgi:putative ABC transport system substrate-binding protein
MRRREFIVLLGGVVSGWPLVASAQSTTANPIVGFLHSSSSDPERTAAVHRGLAELGYVEGRNVDIEYRWAEGHYDQLPALASELVRRRVAVLVAAGAVHTALAAKKATTTIPVVFANGSDPVKFGLVESLNRPAGNITGVSFFTSQLEAKRLGLLHELIPRAGTIAAFVNPTNSNADNQSRDLKEAAKTLGVQLQILTPVALHDFDAAFASAVQMQAGALAVAADPFFFSQHKQLIALAAKHKLPAIYEWGEFADAGGLASYGTSFFDAYRQVGVYAGRLLKGEKPADLPVMQAVKFELVINLKTAKSLGLEISPTLSARADKLIE